MAIAGGTIYILATAAYVCFGRRMAPDDSGLGAAGRGSPPGILNPPPALRTEDAERLRPAGGLGQIPATTVLVFFVLAASITYYFVNRAFLSFVREVG